MPFDWNKYIELGRELCQSPEPEKLRAGISRAYYGLYNRLRIYKGLTTKFRPHKELIDKLFEAEMFEEESEIARALQILKECREDADYDGIITVDKQYVNRFWLRFDDALQTFEENKT